jgi:predicted ATPase
MPVILTPDQRVRVFVSSTLEELAPERAAAKRAIERLQLSPVLFELGARPHPPQELYRAYLEQSHVFVAIYWERYGWVAPGMDVSGLEDELLLAGDRPKLVYLKRPAPGREPRLEELIARVRDDGVSYKAFSSPEELEALLTGDLASMLSEHFHTSASPETEARHVVAPPFPGTALIGRDPEVADVLARLRRDDVRLVTLVGPGGIGKTRLALEVAERLAPDRPDGIAYVALEAVRDPAVVGQAILRALDLRERGLEPAMDLVRRHLSDRRMLLVLDNFEHLLDAAGQIADLLSATTEVKVLATSREPLRLRGEQEVLVPPLSVSQSVELFVDRARARRADLDGDDAVRAICERLEGVPLAIELAAARTRLLTPREILDRLGRQLDLLSSGPRDLPVRQRALRSTIAWSYDLLDAEQQRIFTALGTFAGPFTERSAADVTATEDVLDALASLVDKSLLLVEAPDGELRLRMLGMVRDFAVEQLESRGELDACRARHAAHYRALALAASAPLRTSAQAAWLDRLDADVADLRAALRWWTDQRRFDELAEVAWYLWVFAWLRGYLREMRDGLARTLAEPDVGEPARIRLQAVVGILDVYGGGTDGTARLAEVVERARALGLDDVLAAASLQLAVAGGDGDMDEALALFTQLGDDWGVAATLCAKAWVHVHLDVIDGADETFDAAAAAADRIDDDLVVAMILANLAERSTHRGHLDEAATMVAGAVARYQRLRAAYPASYVVEAAAHLAKCRGRPVDAVRLVSVAERLRASIDTPIWAPAQERHERLVAWLRGELDPDAFAEAWGSVDGLDYEGALSLVLTSLDLAAMVGEGPP